MIDDEKRKMDKVKRLQGMLDSLLTEMADEVVDEKQLKLIERHLRKHITQSGAVYNASTVKVFLEGFEFCMTGFANIGPQEIVHVLMGLKKIVKSMEAPGLSAIEEAMRRTKEGTES